VRPKAIRDLAQLDDNDLFREMAAGWSMVLRNVERLMRGCDALRDAKQYHCAGLLAVIAQEEASKALILTDAARCPKRSDSRFSDQLARFNDHLAKGLYARGCDMRPADLEQLQGYLNHFRLEFYLDGPNDVDWIFRNEVNQHREEMLYVDYVKTVEGHYWSDPGRFEELDDSGPLVPGTVRMARALGEAGIATPEGLRAVAEIWRPVSLSRKTQYAEFRRLNVATLDKLDELGLLGDPPQNTLQSIANEWPFPMYDLDLTMQKVDPKDLRERQQAWNLDW